MAGVSTFVLGATAIAVAGERSACVVAVTVFGLLVTAFGLLEVLFPH